MYTVEIRNADGRVIETYADLRDWETADKIADQRRAYIERKGWNMDVAVYDERRGIKL